MARTLIRSSKRLADDEPTINLTPLIDVVFVILIMFILVAPLLELEQIELATGPVSGEKAPPVQNHSPIAIYVKPDNRIWYNQEAVSTAELSQRLALAHQAYPHAIPQLFQDKKAQFGTYQNVKNVVEGAGFEQLDLILNPG